MKHTPVESSHLLSVGYDGERNQLEITYKNGQTYVYNDVPASVHVDLMGAKSVGGYFHSHIKTNYKAINITDLIQTREK